MNEKEKYMSLYDGSLSELYCRCDARGRVDGGYGRAFWGQGMVEPLRALRPEAVLDVGCGFGRFCDAITRFVPQVYGVDIASVKTGNIIQNPHVTFIDAEAKAIPLPDQAVDWITSFDCLEHCPEDEIDHVLREFDRLAVKGFILSISYDPDYIGDIPLHMTVRPESWWFEKLSAYGNVFKSGRVPLTGVPYLICEKPNDPDSLKLLFRTHKTGNVYIEAGTDGGTGVKAALHAGFGKIYSIEANDQLYEFNTSRFKDHPNVHILKGDSLEVLPHLLHLVEAPSTFWLDTHGEGSSRDGNRSPMGLEQMIDIIGRHEIKGHTLIINDRRLLNTEFHPEKGRLINTILGINPQYRICYPDSAQEDMEVSGIENVIVALVETCRPGEKSDPSRVQPFRKTVERSPDRSCRILYYCPDVPILSAGIRRIYRHVQCLNQHAYNAAVLHQQEGFRAPNQPDVPIRYLSNVKLSREDIVVVPEGHPQMMQQLCASECRRFAMALNWDYIFKTLPDDLDWRHFGIERVLVVSPIVGQLVSWAMGLPIHILNSGINTRLYYYDPASKRQRICYIARKASRVSEVRKLLHARNPELTDKLEWVAMDGLAEQAYAEMVRSSVLFLNLSPAEGWMTSCMEAMRSGTFVAGYNSVGGRDLLIGDGKRQNAVLAPNQDYLTLCLRLEPFLKDLLDGDLMQWEHLRQNGLELTQRMTMEAEENSIIEFWKNIVEHPPENEFVCDEQHQTDIMSIVRHANQ